MTDRLQLVPENGGDPIDDMFIFVADGVVHFYSPTDERVALCGLLSRFRQDGCVGSKPMCNGCFSVRFGGVRP